MPNRPIIEKLPFASSHIADIFGQRAYTLGLEYQTAGACQLVVVDLPAKSIRGAVKGAHDQAYQARVVLNERGFIVGATCTCPVGSYCKHCVALVLEAGSIHGFTEEYAQENALPSSVTHWMEQLKGSMSEQAKAAQQKSTAGVAKAPSLADHSVIYIIDKAKFGQIPSLELTPHLVTRPNSAGFQKVMISTFAAISKADGGNFEDHEIAEFALKSFGSNYLGDVLSGDRKLVSSLIEKIVATGRAHFRNGSNPPLAKGPHRDGRVKWIFRKDRSQIPVIVGERDSIIPLLSAFPLYVDTYMWQIGMLDLPIDTETTARLLSAPPVMPGYAERVHEQLLQLHLPSEVELPCSMLDEKIVKPAPSPSLTFHSINPIGNEALLYWRRGFDASKSINVIDLKLDYEGKSFDLRDRNYEFREAVGDTVMIYKRDPLAEKKILQRLVEYGLDPLPVQSDPTKIRLVMKDDSDFAWLQFVRQKLPALQELNWRVEIEESFTYRVIETDEALDFQISEQSAWWFVLDLGVLIDGQRVSLFPILVSALKRAGHNLADEDIDHLNINGAFYAPLPGGQMIALPFDRVKSILKVVREIFSLEEWTEGQQSLQVSPVALSRLATSNIVNFPKGRVQDIAKKLKAEGGFHPIDTPKNFTAELRSYQKEGLGWLSFLSEIQAGGILADDMGLGKTVQGLAHILSQKERGLLNGPALVVCPTSVAPNWLREAATFAPTLKVLAITSSDRTNKYSQVHDHDLVVTTYPLLTRDELEFCNIQWSIAILDESQYIKNPNTMAAKAAFKLSAFSKFCFSGTPIENKLDELWSQFNFLMPGMLGERKKFWKYYGKPIQRDHSPERLLSLRTRLRPFMLRRTKSEVESELPEKTVMIKQVHLTGAQRDLYEAVRLAMHVRVRNEIRDKGFEKSYLYLLAALTKLRQVCCDPRLVKLEMAREVEESAKLSTLMEMVVELLEEGRKIIIFSQFTGMLDLIADELDFEKISYVQLRGSTKDRATPVESFQNGDVPVFLISLKAGGTGLNLTAADTVIHYDPWWNPASEDQATDRAHRIGQTKPVFVYKLITAGTIEERLLELQNRKKVIADDMFDEKGQDSLNLSPIELEMLLQPVEIVAPPPSRRHRRRPPRN